jgi:H+/Cl- antiporter ClcA
MEMTESHDAILPLLLASVIGVIIARAMDPVSFYRKQAMFFATWFQAPAS